MTTRLFFFSLTIALVVSSCSKKFKIDEIVIQTVNPGVLDTVVMSAISSNNKDGETYEAEMYSWTITDPDGIAVNVISQDKNTATFIPPKEGNYVISVKANGKSKSQTKTTEKIFLNSVQTFQRALVGEWEGSCNAPFFDYGPRTVHFSIDANGHYSSYMVGTPEPPSGSAFTTLANGVDEWDHPEKKFTVEDILENGNAKGTITFMHSGGDLLTYLFDKMSFSNNFQVLKFNSGHFEPQYLNISYVLTKQN